MITLSQIRPLFLSQDMQRGREYYLEGRVGDLQVDVSDQDVFFTCRVHGSKDYRVWARIAERELQVSCQCPRYESGYHCKHIAAAFYAYISDYQDKMQPARTSFAGSQLLETYLSKSDAQEMVTDPVHLQLQYMPSRARRGYPEFRLMVGRNRMYVVQNLMTFLNNVSQRATASYGKGLTFNHAIENFDEDARELIRLMLGETAQFTNSGASYYSNSSPVSYDSRRLSLTGSGFDRLFDLLPKEIAVYNSGRETMRFTTEDPELIIRLRAIRGGAEMSLEGKNNYHFFGTGEYLYAETENRIMRCSSGFRDSLNPLLSQARREFSFAEKDLPVLCDCVLPSLKQYAEIDDRDNLLEQYAPDTCEPAYYLDLDPAMGLMVQLRFRYGDTEIPDGAGADAYGSIRRNARAEQQYRRTLERRFQYDDRKNVFFLPDEEKMLDFLTDGVADLQMTGTVFISDTLQNKFLSTERRPTVGVSVSMGMLTLTLDTGEFPPEELEELYQSLLKKKRYHKLRDGRYLELDGSGYEKVAEVAHMTMLSPRELRNGKVVMPAYRGLYLDLALGKGEELDLNRDAEFRRLVRDFRNVEDSDYQVPEGLENVLRPYQKVGFQWMKTLEANGFGGILADEMGLGKTVEAIAYLRSVYDAGQSLPSLIVCPASLILNWSEELTRFSPELSQTVLIGNAVERQRLIAEADSDVWITSYDLLKRDTEQFADKVFYCCILDEGQHVKNPSTQASKAVKALVSRQRFVLTGTPIENRLSELWNLFDFLMPGFLFSHNAFVSRLEKPIIQNGDANAQRQLSLLVQPFMLRRLKKDVLKELPDKLEYIRKVPLTVEERKVYQAAAWEARKTAEVTEGKLQILALLTRLRQICCDPSLCFENYTGSSSKLEACMSLCRSMVENGHQILLFSQFTTMLDRIREELNREGISNFTLEGSTPREKRAQLVKDFGAGQASVFLISLRAGGTGLNLTSADVVIHYDPWWNLAVQNQATDRAHRIGQHQNVQVYKLIAADTIEEKILDLQERKRDLLDTVTEDVGLEPLSREELLELLR